ncbi:SprB repeat-containing protein, partial [Tenacibaculum sp. MEBiC06402]
MKRKILFILGILFFSFNTVQSQNYKINITGYISQGHSSCGTINGLREVILIYRNGTTKKIHDIDYYINKSYNLTDTFTHDNPVVQVEYLTRARHKTWIGDCRSGNEARKRVSVTLPCQEQRFEKDQIYVGNIRQGWSRITVYPLPSLKYPDNYNIGLTRTVCQNGSVKIAATFKTYPSPSTVYKWEFYDPVNTVTTTTSQYQTLLNTRDNAYRDWQDCENFNGGGGDPIFRAANTKTDKKKNVQSDKVVTKDKNTNSKNLIPLPGPIGDPSPGCRMWYDRYVDAWNAVQNFTGEKYYQRKLWRPIPSKDGQPEIDLKLSDLYSSTEDQFKALNKLKINIRLNPGCNGTGDISDNIAVLQFSPEPPPIAKKPTFDSPTCSYDPIDNFVIYFTRQLLSTEKLNINLKKKLTSPPYTYETIGNNINISSLVQVSANEYKYTWNPSNGNELPEAGDYRIVLSGASGNPYCNNGTLQYDFTITIPPKVNFLTATKEQDVTCFNGSDGKIKITASGGSNSFQYSIDNRATWSSAFSSSTIITGLSAGTTKVWLRDTNSCIDQSNQSRDVYLAPKTKITHVVSSNTNDIVHPGSPNGTDGSIKINSVSGGTPSGNQYNYEVLLNGNNSTILTGTVSGTISTIISGLPKGTHKIRYTDSKGCTSDLFTLPILNDPAPVNFTYNIVNATCNGSNGQIKVSNITGGYANYKIKLEKSGMIPQEFTNVAPNTEKVFSVAAGTYKVTVTDTRSGSKIESSIEVTEPDEITVTNVTATAIQCNGGKSTVTVSINNRTGVTYEYAEYKPTGMIWQSSNVFSLDASPTIGYRFVARDKNQISCKSQPSSVIRISEPSEISLGTPTIKHNTVFNGNIGEIQLPISGGTSGYTVTWTRNGSSIGNTGATITGLLAGTYIATVKDANDCVSTSGNIIVNQPDKLEVNVTIDQALNCNGASGTVRANATGGSESYTYKWYRNNTLISGASSVTFTGITGDYKVEVSDGFTSATSAIKNLPEPTLVQLSLTKEDITCNALDNGQIKLNVSGGTSPYYYSIDDKTTYSPISSLSNSTITGLTDGTFNVWVKDANNCEIATAVSETINRPSQLEISNFTVINNQVINDSSGEVQIAVNGGTSPYTYEWTDKFDPTFLAVTQNIANLPASTYNVVIKDANDCEITQDFEVKEPLPLSVTITQTNDILCFGDETGALFAQVTGGYPLNSTPSDFDYKWYKVEGTSTTLLNGSNLKLDNIQSLKAGNYRVVVNDVKGTSTSKDFSLTEPPRLSVTISSQNDVSCFDGNDGDINITVSGGTAPYTFEWTNALNVSFSASSEDVAGLKKGDYKVVVKDDNGCESVISDIKMEQPTAPLSFVDETIINLTGFETNNGSISVTVDGGTPNYTYEWRVKGESTVIGTTNLIENRAAGIYEVTITDNNSCTLIKEYTISQPELLVVGSVNASGSILCNGDETVDLEATGVVGGVSPYTYEWVVKGSTDVLSTTTTLNGIGAGVYEIKVLDTNGNQAVKEYTVIEPELLTISDVQSQNVSCFDGNDAFIDLTISGGVGPYTYSWKHGATTSRIENLIAGTYEVTVRDKNLCEVSQSFTITEPAEALSIVNETVVNLTGFETANGSISVDVNGGTPNYTYEWRVKGEATVIGNSNLIKDLTAGNYEVTITDINSCILVEDYVITQPDLLEVDIQENTSILCNGDNGTLVANVIGGVASYNYEWFVKDSTTVLASTSNLNNTSGNIYVVKVIDSNGNETSAEYTVFEPEVLEISSVQTQNVSCFDGNDGFIDLTVSGGIAPYSYSWKHGETTSRIENLRQGTYEVTIRDKNLCEFTQSFTISQPSSRISLTNISVVNLTGFETGNGSISVDVLGGTPNYSYEWRIKGETAVIGNSNLIDNLSANRYELTVSDANSCSFVEEFLVTQPSLLDVDVQETLTILCNGDNGTLKASATGGVGPYTYEWTFKNDATVLSTTTILENTIGATYVIKVTDANNNEAVKEYTVVEPEILAIADVQSQNISCFEGNDAFIDVTISGGVEPYSYSWKHGATTSRIENLTAGNYEVTIRDKNLCEISQSFTITEPAEALKIASDTVVNLTGFETDNGSVSVNVIGGTPNYTYEWRIQGESSIIGNSNVIENLSAGVYELTLSDSNSCSLIKEYTVTQPDLLEVDVQETTSILCNGDNGELTANVSGGVTPYTYEWTVKNTTTVLSSTNILDNTSGNTYVLKVSDANGNETIKEYTVVEPEALMISDVQSQNVSCFGGNDAFIDVTIIGGIPPYSYSWNNGETTNKIENLIAGTYEVTIRDKNLCEISQSFTITEPAAALSLANETVINLTGFETNNGSISIDVVGGTPDYTYEWRVQGESSIIGSSNVIENLSAGVYELTLSDGNSCSLTKEYTITQPDLLEVNVQETSSILCNGNTGNLFADVSGGVAPYTFEWRVKGNSLIIGNNNVLENINSDVYEVRVIDANGNEAIVEYNLTQPLKLEITDVQTSDVTCYNGNNGFLEITVNGGVAPYTYSWNHTTDNINRLENLTSGNYSVTISDLNGCEIQQNVEIQQPAKYDIISVKLDRPSSDIVNDGVIEVEITGGVAPYNYLWTDEIGTVISNQTSSLTVDRIENLGEGTYTIVVTDATNCVINETYNLANPGEILVSITQLQEIKCYNSSNAILDVITVGGVGGNSYQWFNASNDQLIGTEKQLKNIPAGEYYVIVSNAEGIQEKSSIFIVSQPEELKVNVSKNDVSCFGFSDGNFQISVQGGSGDYEYRYRTTASYSDWNTISGNNVVVSDLLSGNYTFQVRDVNNCLALDSLSNDEFSVTIDQPAVLELSNEEVVNLSGFELSNGSIKVEV